MGVGPGGEVRRGGEVGPVVVGPGVRGVRARARRDDRARRQSPTPAAAEAIDRSGARQPGIGPVNAEVRRHRVGLGGTDARCLAKLQSMDPAVLVPESERRRVSSWPRATAAPRSAPPTRAMRFRQPSRLPASGSPR